MEKRKDDERGQGTGLTYNYEPVLTVEHIDTIGDHELVRVTTRKRAYYTAGRDDGTFEIFHAAATEATVRETLTRYANGWLVGSIKPKGEEWDWPVWS